MFSKSAQAARAWTKVARAARAGKRKGRTRTPNPGLNNTRVTVKDGREWIASLG